MEPETLRRAWLTRLLRLTVFTETPATDYGDLWGRLVSEPPEIDQAQPRQHTRLQAAPWREGVMQLQLSTTPFRIDLNAVADEQASTDWQAIASVLPDFRALTQTWLTGLHALPLKRIAFGVHALLPAENKVEGYRILDELIPSVRIDPEGSTDFLYNINRPVDSRVLAGVRLNRLTKWGWLRLSVVRLGITAGEAAQSTPIASGDFVSVECDHSTPGEREASLPGDRLDAIYDELIDLAWKNLEFGELPP